MSVSVPSLSETLRAFPRQSFDYVRSIPTRYKKLQPAHKAVIWVLVAAHVILIGSLVAIGPKRTGDFFAHLAASIQALGWPGYFVVGSMIALAATPPFFGFASSLTFCGFTFGLWPGIPIAWLGTLAGSSLAFGLYRFVLRKQFKNIVGKGRDGGKWEAFQAVVKSKSLPLLIALRWCPLPFALSNGFFATLESVSFFHFFTATVCMLPRLIIAVFIGSRLDNLADSEERQSMDRVAKLLNVGSIVLGFAISFAIGWWIYGALLAHIAKMKAESGAFLEDGEGAVGDRQGTGESDTLLLHFSDEEEEGFAQVAEAEDEGEVLALVR